jgi:hypothetical protein
MQKLLNAFFQQQVDYEECFILCGKRNRLCWWTNRLLLHSKGSAARVKFQRDYALQNRFEIIGWLHSHPNMPASPSQTDHTTMCAWVLTLGRPLVCCILGNDGLKVYWYLDDENPPEEKRAIYFNGRLIGFNPRSKRVVVH